MFFIANKLRYQLLHSALPFIPIVRELGSEQIKCIEKMKSNETQFRKTSPSNTTLKFLADTWWIPKRSCAIAGDALQ